MKKLLTVSLSIVAHSCLAQYNFTALADTPLKTGKLLPAYRTLSDTAGKPFTKLFANSDVVLIGRLRSSWAIVKKADVDYVIPTKELPEVSQQVVARAQPLKQYYIDPELSVITYSDVVPAPGASQAELYTRAKLWFATTFPLVDGKGALQVDEREAGILQGAGFRDLYLMAPNYGMMMERARLLYSVKISVKDGRSKYEVSRFRVQFYPNKVTPVPGDPYPIETYFQPEQPNGVMRDMARSTRRQLVLAGNDIANSITVEMSRPATGAKVAKDW